MPGIIGFETGVITPTGTGNQSYAGLTHLPVALEFWYSRKTGSAETINRFGRGSFDGTNHFADCTYRDGSGPLTDEATDRIIIALDRNVSVQRRLEASVVSFDNLGGGVYGFTLNQQNQAISVPVFIKAYYAV